MQREADGLAMEARTLAGMGWSVEEITAELQRIKARPGLDPGPSAAQTLTPARPSAACLRAGPRLQAPMLQARGLRLECPGGLGRGAGAQRAERAMLLGDARVRLWGEEL